MDSSTGSLSHIEDEYNKLLSYDITNNITIICFILKTLHVFIIYFEISCANVRVFCIY